MLRLAPELRLGLVQSPRSDTAALVVKAVVRARAASPSSAASTLMAFGIAQHVREFSR
jgi:hypothetical protein